MKYIAVLFAIIFALTISINADETTKITIKANPNKLLVKAGETVDILVKINVDKKYYTYALETQLNKDQIGPTPTEITIQPAESFEPINTIFAKEPKVKPDEGFEMDIKYYKDEAYFVLKLVATKDIDFSKDSIFASMYAQTCDHSQCFPPEEFKSVVSGNVVEINDEIYSHCLEYSVEIVEGYPVATLKNGTNKQNEVESSKTKVKQESKGSLLDLILRALANGILSLFMPCVFPMIPITVSFFTKRSENNKGKGLADAITYALGIVGTFTVFGLLVSVIFGATGMQDMVSNPWFNIFVVAIFIFFGLSLLGAYEIQVPTSITNKLDAKSRQGNGMFSVILMSATFSLASFSCTGPFIADALVASAGGDWFYPMISMIAFSAALAFPFFFLALFPAAMSKMPRAGAWMNSIKIVLGLVVVSLATKYLHSALLGWGTGLERNFVLAIYAGVGLLITLYILGVFKTPHDAPVNGIAYLRLLFALLFATLTFYMISGFTGGSLGFMEGMLPAREITSTSVNAADDWLHSYDEAIAKAKETNKNVFLDFTGQNCTNCKKMDGDMFPRPAVAEAMSKMVKVKLYTDIRNDAESNKNKKMQLEQFGTVALPTYIIINPDGKEIARISYTSSEDEFLNFLNKGAK